jgi:hypothetical protein
MADYSVESYSIRGSFQTVLTALETKINSIDDRKTLRRISIVNEGNTFRGYIIYDK